MLDALATDLHGVIDDALEGDIPAFAVGDVGGEHQTRAAGLNPIGQRPGPKPGEDHRMNGADAHGRQHQDDGFGAGGHVNRQAITFLHTHGPQGCRDALDFARQLSVGEELRFAPLVHINQRRMATPPALHMVVEAIVGQIGLSADKPAKGREVPLEDAIPGAEPVQRGGGTGPEVVVMFLLPPGTSD